MFRVVRVLGSVDREQVEIFAANRKRMKIFLRTLLCNGRVLKQSVKKNVSYQDRPALQRIIRSANSFPAEIPRIIFRCGEQNLADLVGDDAILFLGLGDLTAAAACLDMGKRNVQARCEQSSR